MPTLTMTFASIKVSAKNDTVLRGRRFNNREALTVTTEMQKQLPLHLVTNEIRSDAADGGPGIPVSV